MSVFDPLFHHKKHTDVVLNVRFSKCLISKRIPVTDIYIVWRSFIQYSFTSLGGVSETSKSS